MHDSNHELLLRIETLERKNRRYTRIGALALCAALGGVFLSWRAPCDTVSAERFVLVDPSGKQRATLSAYETGAPQLTFLDKKGRAVATLATDADGAFLALTDAKGEKSVRYAAASATGAKDSAHSTATEPKPEAPRDGVGATSVGMLR